MVKSRWDRRLLRFIGRLYAIIMHLMLHFSLVFGFFICSRGIHHLGFATCVRHASWIGKDVVSFG